MERTLAPVSPVPPVAEATPTEIPEELQRWVVDTIGDRSAGLMAVRPFEYDPGFEVLFESNNIARMVPSGLLQSAFDAKVSSAYFVEADRNVNFDDQSSLVEPILIAELVLVHASDADASNFVGDFRNFAVGAFGGISESYLKQSFPNVKANIQQDTGFGVAEEELVIIGDYDTGSSQTSFRPQVYVMVVRQRGVNIALMALYLDPAPRLKPFGMLDRIVARVR